MQGTNVLIFTNTEEPFLKEYLQACTIKVCKDMIIPDEDYDLIITELNKIIKEGITEEELSAIKRYSFGEFQQVGQTVGALVGYYSSYFYEDDIVELKEVSEIINSIKKEEIKDLASEFINSGIWGFGELGNITEAKNKKAYNKFAKELFKEK